MAGAAGIVEGATRIFAPATNLAHLPRQPGRREKGQPFYNPGMALNRDLSVLLVEAFARQRSREVDVADALAGTGARALRLANEVDAAVLVHANDGQVEAVAAMRRGVEANPRCAAGRVAVHGGDAHTFLAARRFDVVDLDPCGSPMPFLDAAVRATRHGGLVCATATDTGALAGAFPKACRRRYDAHHGLHVAPWRAEVGLRILGGAMVRSAARFDRVATPVLSISHGHWMRVVARIEDGKSDTDAGLRRLQNAALDDDGLGRFVARADASVPWAGPLWSGPLHDAALVETMAAAAQGKTLARGAEVGALLAILQQESVAAPFWIVGHDWEAELGPPPRRDVMMARLRAAGFASSRTHMDAQGVRTDAPMQAIKAAWRANAA